MLIYFRFVGNGKMSVILNFENQYFAEKIDGFENARENYVNASSKNKKVNKLPTKVSYSFIMKIK